MSTFLNFLSAAADFALTLNLKVAIVAAGFIVLLVLTRPHPRERPRNRQDTGASHVRRCTTGGWSTPGVGRNRLSRTPVPRFRSRLCNQPCSSVLNRWVCRQLPRPRYGTWEYRPAFLRGFFCNRALCNHAGGR